MFAPTGALQRGGGCLRLQVPFKGEEVMLRIGALQRGGGCLRLQVPVKGEEDVCAYTLCQRSVIHRAYTLVIRFSIFTRYTSITIIITPYTHVIHYRGKTVVY